MDEGTVDLSPYAASLTQADALHLLRRATFHPTWEQSVALTGKSASEATDVLMALNPEIQLPSWANDPPALTQETGPPLWSELQNWWVGHCTLEISLRERMMLMWHNIFTSDYRTVYASQWMVGQSQLIRNQVYNYRGISMDMVGNPAMLRYLNGNQSVKGNPNENFGREWFELFSLGIGNYTEQDIVEASRAFTGWSISGLEGVYNRQLADLDEKTILGKTGNWEWNDVIDITLETEACSKYIAGRLIRTFVEFYPSDEAIDQIATLIRDNDYNLQPVIKTLLSSVYFYTAELRGALIKDPMQLVIGLATMTAQQNIDPRWVKQAMTSLTMAPFYPPTVQGWSGHHAWITSSTFPNRQRFGESFLDGRVAGSSTKLTDRDGMALDIDLVSVVKQMPDFDDAEKVVGNVALLLLPVPTTAEQRAVLLDIMMAGAPAYTWDIETETANSRLKLLIQAIVRMPEYQLT